MNNGDPLASCGTDFIGCSFEIDGPVIVDPPGRAQRKVEVEQGSIRRRAHPRIRAQDRLLPHFAGDLSGVAFAFVVLPGDFHVQDLVRFVILVDLGVEEEGDEAVLKGSEAALYLAFGLRCWSYQVGHT